MNNDIAAMLAADERQLQAQDEQQGREYLQYLLDLSADTADTRFLFNIGGVSTIPAGELIGIKGRAKMGKSQFAYYLAGVMLAGEQRGNVSPLVKQGKILVFDTEQSRASLQKCCRRALQLAGRTMSANYADFRPFTMRSLTPEERRQSIAQAIATELPDVVVIDGIRDLLHNFNDLNESSDVIQWLLTLTAEHGCTILCVLHQNKAKDDGNMRGHLGTELLNKLTDCFEVDKKDGRFTATCTDSRNVPCPDISFIIDGDGCFKCEVGQAVGNEKEAKMRCSLELCFNGHSELRYNDLVEAYRLEGAVSTATAKNHIRQAKAAGMLQVKNGAYVLIPQKTENIGVLQ